MSVNNAGTYKCEAVNDMGRDFVEVDLKILKSPRVKMIRSHIELTEGLNYTLSCEVSDGEQIQWLDHDGKVLLKVGGLLDYF